MSIKIKQSGNFNKTTRFLMSMKERKFLRNLEKYGRKGVDALSDATPVNTGKTAESWDYEIHWTKGTYTICWTNSNMAEAGMPIAVLIQYGHGTRNGGYVQGRDFINPAIAPIFDKIANDAWKEVVDS